MNSGAHRTVPGQHPPDPGPPGPDSGSQRAHSESLRPDSGSLNAVAGPHRNAPQEIAALLHARGARWAVVGLSTNARRAAYEIGSFLTDELGMDIIPVHPRAESVHGRQGYARLSEIPGAIDVVDIFVNSSLAGAVVDEAIAIGARAVWLQLGVIDEGAAARARAAGLVVVMDTCPAIEARR